MCKKHYNLSNCQDFMKQSIEYLNAHSTNDTFTLKISEFLLRIFMYVSKLQGKIRNEWIPSKTLLKGWSTLTLISLNEHFWCNSYKILVSHHEMIKTIYC